ncbi:MAG: FtsX-like permease family protein, partial [Bacteroidota bacterium]
LQIPYEENPMIIRGVIRDYHHFSLHKAYNPALIRYTPIHHRYFILDVQTQNLASLINQVEEKYQATFPGNAFEYQFMDAVFNAQYRSERRLGALISLFAGLAMLVAGLGLLGLLSFSLSQRRREIGIRRVLGASLSQMVLVLGKEFMLLVGLAMGLTIPLGWWSIQIWLERYPFRFEVGPLLFVWPCLGMVGLASLMIALETRRSVRFNPIDALRSE